MSKHEVQQKILSAELVEDFVLKVSRESTKEIVPPYLKHVNSTTILSAIWFKGKYEKKSLFPERFNLSGLDPCVKTFVLSFDKKSKTTPFGLPVVPEVKTIVQVSFSLGT